MTGANRHDSVSLDELLRRRVTPEELGLGSGLRQNLCLDAGYAGRDDVVRSHGMIPHIRPRGEERGEKARDPGFKPRRWVVEAAHSWFNRFRKINVRYEKTTAAYTGLIFLAAMMIAMNKVMKIYPVM